MNKRQWKKKQGKYLPLFPDEYPLFTMTEDERKKAIEDFRAYREKYAFRKKYKDLKRDLRDGKSLFYSYQMGATYMAIMKKFRDVGLSGRKFEPIMFVQKLSDFD